jgi:hypothetical protein
MRAPTEPDNRPLFEYTLMPTHIRSPFSVAELQDIELAEPFSFTKGCRVMKIEGLGWSLNSYLWGTLLFDLEKDPNQEHPIKDDEIEKRMIGLMVDLMRKNDAPPEQYTRLGLPRDGKIEDHHLNLRRILVSQDTIGNTQVTWRGTGRLMYYTLLHLIPLPIKRQFVQALEEQIHLKNCFEMDEDQVLTLIQEAAPKEYLREINMYSQVVKLKA